MYSELPLPRSELYDLVPNGELNQITIRTKVEFPHNIGPVRVHGLDAEAERGGYFFVAVTQSK